jgi:ABC-type Na+ efflux pump permease subunit
MLGAPIAMSEEAGTEGTKKKRGCGFWILVIIAVFIGLAVLGSLLPEPTQEEKIAAAAKRIAAEEEEMRTEKAAADARRSSAIKVSASQLFAAYQANEMAAQQQFDGRVLEVSGRISGVELDFNDDPVVKLQTQNQFMPVSVYLTDEFKSAAAGLNKGDNALFLCEEVSEVISMPQLKGCVPIE